MKYNQPYGAAANAPFVNGDPSIGRAGSIPPAEAIEYPQKEIVHVIESANLATPSDSDLYQLSKAIQSQLMQSDDDEGTQNQYQVTLSPAPTAYYKYLTVRIKIANTNTGASTINVNALGGKAIVNQDGSAVSAGQLKSGAVVCLVYNGTSFQVAWGAGTGVPSAGPSGDGGGTGPIYLIQATVLYVNNSTGNDTYDGTVSAFTSGIHGPFKTLQRAATEVNKWNLNGYSVTINVADATYTGPLTLPDPGGNGTVTWQGNNSTPINCLITTANQSNVIVKGVKNYMTGFGYRTTGSNASDPCYCLALGGTVQLRLDNFEISGSAGNGVLVYGGAYLRLGPNMRFTGTYNTGPYSTGAVFEVNVGGKMDTINTAAQTLYVNGVVATKFISVTLLSTVVFDYSTLTGSGATCQRYNVTTNSVLTTSGGGANYVPGNSAGATASGGQYL